MNMLLKRHFIVYEQNLNDVSLETFALKCIKENRRTIFLDLNHNSERCLKNYFLMTKRKSGNSEYMECTDCMYAATKSCQSEMLFARVYSENKKEFSIGEIITPFLQPALANTIILLSLSSFEYSKKDFEDYMQKLYKYNIQLGIRTDDEAFFKAEKELNNIISYQTLSIIDLL